MKKILLLFAFFGLMLSACSEDESFDEPQKDPAALLPVKEMRGVWFTTAYGNDWPMTFTNDVVKQKQLYIDYLDLFVKLRLNAVFVQVRPMADAFYQSSLEPWSATITGTPGKDPGYDVLKFMLDEAHARGLEFHAWINPYRIATRASDKDVFVIADNHIAKLKPELTNTYEKVLWFNPALPEVQDHLKKVVDELITKYDIDGLHLDDYFYPEGVTIVDTAEYRKYGGTNKTVADFRRANVSKMVEEIHKTVTSKKPDVLFSVSPAYDQVKNNNELYADVTNWCQNGWLDIVIPQLYISTTNTDYNFKKWVHWWPQFSYKAAVMTGYGLHLFYEGAAGSFGMNEELALQFHRSRLEPKMKGSILYTAKSLVDNKLEIVDILKSIYPEPAVIPFIGRKTLPDPSPATNLRLQGDQLSWSKGDGALRSVVYKLGTSPSTSKVVTITNGTSCKLPERGKYVVTIVNADNNESKFVEELVY